MSRKDKDKPQQGGQNRSGDSAGDDRIQAGGWEANDRPPRWRQFPACGADEIFRVTFTRQAYADVTEHAKQDLESEVCGILAGEFCEDDDGLYVSVVAAVRGTSVRRGAAHVTYTQETWNEIHRVMESDYPKLQIVGWYHSHPGFGVEFSDMDMFIQENFFAARGQVALVTDPLGGSEALCAKVGSRVEHLGKFWVDGRERKCILPAGVSRGGGGGGAEGGHGGSGGGSGELAAAVRKLEDRVNQALREMERSRKNTYGSLTFLGMLAASAIVAYIVLNIWWHYTEIPQPNPQIFSETPTFSSEPMKVNNEWVRIGTKSVLFKVPLSPHEVEILDKLEADQAAAKAAAEQAAKKAAKPDANKPAAPPATKSSTSTQPATAPGGSGH